MSSRPGQVFISYSSEDRQRAKQFADALQSEGCSVWWDRRIAAGQTFDEVIEQALNDAGCVVVLWSARSVKSDWVKTEASDAASRGILVPALIDKVRIPLEFRRLQAADLTQWNGRADDPEFQLFVQAVKAEVQQSLENPPRPPTLYGSVRRDPSTQVPVRRDLAPVPERKQTAPPAPPATAPSPTTDQLAVPPARSTHPSRAIVATVAALTGVAIVAGLTWWYAGRGVQAPNVVDKPFADAVVALNRAALLVERREQATDSVSAETILAQDPPAGATVATGARIVLTVAVAKVPAVVTAADRSDTPAPEPPSQPAPAAVMVAVPNVRGQTAQRAAELLAAAGLVVGVRNDVADNDRTVGEVIGQQPDPTQSVAKGSPVDVTVVARRTVPSLTGVMLREARQTLDRLGVTQRIERVRASPGERDGQVLKQEPAAGADIEPGGQATLTVATVAPKTLPGGERLFETNGSRCFQICKEAGLTFKQRWNGRANTCTCD